MKKVILLILATTSGCSLTQNTSNTYHKQASPEITYYVAEHTKKSDAPYSDATIVNNVIYIAGQIGRVPGTRKLVAGGIREETQQAMKNIQSIVTELGSSMDKVFKCTCMLDDISEWGAMSEAYKTFFKEGKRPSRSAFAATGLALGAKVEIECWAIK